jgi:hypothetical protein
MIVHGHALRPPYIKGENADDYRPKRKASVVAWTEKAGLRRRKKMLQEAAHLEGQDLSALTAGQLAEVQPTDLRRPPRRYVKL